MNNRVVVFLLLALALIAGIWASIAVKPAIDVKALYYETPRAFKAFELIEQNGNAFSINNFKNKWSFIFTGYTYCPDICPTTMALFNSHYANLQKIADNTQVVLISVDPQRDKPERLKEYVEYFNPEFVAATAEHKDLFPFVRNIGLMYSMVSDAEEENYLVDHSASIVLVNPNGHIQAIFKPEHVVGEIPGVNFEMLTSDFAEIAKRF